MINKHIIAFREGKLLIEKPGENEKDPLLLISFLGQLGKALSPDCKGKISQELEKEILDSLVSWAVPNFGLGKTWLTVYDDPQTVLSKTDFELKCDQFLLYLAPDMIEEIKSRDGKDNFWSVNHFKISEVLEPIGTEDFSKISYDLLSSKVPLGPEKETVLRWFLENREYLKVPEEVPSKETLCMLLDYIDYPITSSTDILRYVAYWSNLDYKDPKILGHLKISSSLRRKRACKILEDLVSRKKPEILAAEMNRFRSSWLAFTKAVHPNSPEIREVFNLIFGKNKSWKKLSWGNQIRKAYDSNDWNKVISLYSQRPGEFVRHFDSLLRRFVEIKGDYMMNLLETLASSKISSRMLLNLSYYYDKRDLVQKNRTYLNKKGVRIHYDRTISNLDGAFIEIVQDYIMSSLRINYSSQESLKGKKVLLALNPGIELNLSERFTQKGGIKSNMQGVKIELPKTGLLRFFLQWIDPLGTNDLDLHAQGVLSDGKLIDIGWNVAFKDIDKIVVHSGDIRCQKGDCAEYITIDVEKAIKRGLEKIVITGHDFEKHRLGSSCETYIGCSMVNRLKEDGEWVPLESNTTFRARLQETDKPFMNFFVVDLKKGWFKVITEIMKGVSFTDTADFELHFRDKTLNLGKLVDLNVKARGGEIVTEINPEEKDEVIVINESNFQEWTNILLG